MKLFVCVLVLFVMGLCIGCDQADTVRESASNSDVVGVEDDDREMNAAMEKARATLSTFEESWNSKSHVVYSIKLGVTTSNGDKEHIWFTPVRFDDETITGICGNDPVDVRGLKFGDERSCSRQDVPDWMMLTGKKCWGGYTIRVLTKRDPAAAPPLEFMD